MPAIYFGKVAVATGAASGIGLGGAQRLASEGASVVLIDSRGDQVRQCTQGITLPGVAAIATEADVTWRGVTTLRAMFTRHWACRAA